jgi:hypothetical protein
LQPQAGFHEADLTFGIGNFFNYLPDGIKIYGNELDGNAYTVCKFLYPKAILERSDFMYYAPEEKFDLVIGNPPFNLRTVKGVSQYAYIEKACEVLKYDGLLAVIVPVSFLSDEFQDKGKIAWINKHYNFVLQSLLPAESFEATIETKLLVLQKKGIDSTDKLYVAGDFMKFETQIIYENKIAPIYEQNKKDAPKLHMLAVQDNIADAELQYQIRKHLWHIKSNPTLKEKYYSKSLARLEQLKTQLKPQYLDNKEWDKAKLTPEKINRWLMQILKNQNKLRAKKEIKIVRTNYGLKSKAYHKSLQPKAWEKSVHDLILTGQRFEPYKKLYDRKKKFLDNQIQPITTMQRSKVVDKFLDDFVLEPYTINNTLFPETDTSYIRLNEMQKKDLGLSFQKQHGLLAWEHGGGKSVAGMCWMKYLLGKCVKFFSW